MHDYFKRGLGNKIMKGITYNISINFLLVTIVTWNWIWLKIDKIRNQTTWLNQ